MALVVRPDCPGPDDVELLAVRLRFLTNVSRSLAATRDPRDGIERAAELAIPAVFDGIEIDVRDLETLPHFSLRRGTTGGLATHAVPITAYGRSLGTLRVTSLRGRGFDAIDRAIAEDLAVRLGIALWTAETFARERRVADTLQRALLPELLPQSDRFRHSAAYLPATDEASVGGDWYDVFDLPDGRVAFSVGDVAGHGLRAAIVMGEVRQAIRAAAVDPEAPSHVLERANSIVNLRSDHLMVTALFGILDHRTATLTYAVAGHPAPILAVPNGHAAVLPSGGIALGVADSVQTRDWTFTIAPGSLVLFYTDGLIEHSHDPVEGERELLAAARSDGFSANSNPAKAVVDSIFAGRRNVDDVAVLALSTADHPDEDFAFEFSAVPLGVPVMRHALARYAERQGLDGEACFELVTAVGEAAANAVEHAYSAGGAGIVRVNARRERSALVVTVSDEGQWKANDACDERGRGIRIMRSLMDRVEIRRSHANTTIQLITSIATP